MADWMYYGSLLVVLFIAIHFFRGGHILLSFVTLLVGAWIVYSEEENVTYYDVKENIYQSIDEAAKSEYNKKGIESSVYDYNKSAVK